MRISSGSTEAGIEARAMEKLPVETHTVTFVYEDWKASATFFIHKKLPPTGDRSRPALWLLLIVPGTAGLALVGIRAYTANKEAVTTEDKRPGKGREKNAGIRFFKAVEDYLFRIQPGIQK